MHIDPKDTLAGYPILVIRDLLRACAAPMAWSERLVQYRLGTTYKKARHLIEALMAQGLVEPYGASTTGRLGAWQLTVRGNALAMASARPPVRRSTAQRALAKLLDRMETVRDEDRFLYQVERAAVFGSYLSDKDRLSDIDVFYCLQAREKDRDRLRVSVQEHIRVALARGREFRNISEELHWPRAEVTLFLRARSPIIHLHDMEDDPLHLEVPQLLIYTAEKGRLRRPRIIRPVHPSSAP